MLHESKDDEIFYRSGFFFRSNLKYCLFFLFLLLPFGASAEEIHLMGASPGGSYSFTVSQFKKRLAQKFKGVHRFKILRSAGSVENVQALQGEQAQIALVQEDVAHYFHQGGHRLLKIPHKSRSQLKSLAFTFWEYLFVIARPNKKGLSDLNKVNIGSLYGGGSVTAINLQEQLQYHWSFDNTADPIAAFQNPKVDAVIVLISNLSSITDRLRKKKLPFKILNLENNEQKGLSASFPFYWKASPMVRNYQGKKVQVRTISTRALLTVHRKLPLPVVRYLLSMFIDPQLYKKVSAENIALRSIHSKGLEDLRSETNLRFTRFPLPVHPVVFEFHWGKYPYLPLYVVGGPLFLLILLLVGVKRYQSFRFWQNQKRSWSPLAETLYVNTWTYLLLASGVFWYVVVSTNIIKYVEIQAFLQNEVASPSSFVYMGLKDITTWVFVFTVTGYEDDIFPKTAMGKIFASSIRIVTISSVMFILGRMSADYLQNLIRGKAMDKGYQLREHIVICNWNDKGEQIIEELHSPLLKEHKMARPVLVLAKSDVKFPNTAAFEDTFCIPGDASSDWRLKNANIQDAYAVILLADHSFGEQADHQTLMIAMEVVELFDEFEAQGTLARRPHIAAEVLFAKNVRYLRRAGVNEVISGGDLSVKLLAQTAVTPGITAFMDDLLHYSACSNEVYIVDAPKELLDAQADVEKITEFLLKRRLETHSALFVGIQRAGSPPKMMVNPNPKQFKGLQEGDKLVLIARNRPIFSS